MTTLLDLLKPGATLVGGKLSTESRALLSQAFGGSSLAEAAPPPPTTPPVEPDDDKLFEDVADRLDAADAEAIRANPEAKRRFVKQLKNSRALSEEKREREQAQRAAAAEAAKIEYQNRLARLGREIGKGEQGP